MSVLTTVVFAVVLSVACTAAYAQPLPSLASLAEKASNEGYEHHKAGRYGAAIEAYTRSIRIRANNPLVWSNRGLAYLTQAAATPTKELYLNAIADFSEALKLRPGYAQDLKSRGDCYHAMRVIDSQKYAPLAIADYTEYLKTNASDGAVLLRRAEAYDELNRTSDAVADLTKAIAINPRDTQALFRRGTVRYNNKLAGAEKDFEAVLAIDPNHPAAARWLTSARPVGASVPPKQPLPVAAKPAPPAGQASQRSAPAAVPAKVPTAAGDPWEAPLAEAKRLLAAGQPNQAMTYLRNEIAKVPPDGGDALANLFNTRHRSLLQEQIARAQLANRDYAGSLETMTSALTNLLDAVSKDLQVFTKQMPTIPDRDVIGSLYELRIPTSTDLFEMAGRGMEMFSGAPLPENLKLRPLVLGMLKVGAGEIVADLYHVVAKGHIMNAEECRGRNAVVCGPASGKDRTATEAKLAMQKMNRAIAIAPAVKELYATRSRIYRFLGDAAAAAADQVRSMEK